jgi:hypothetical protein
MPALIKQFSSKYYEIVKSVASREHTSGFIDKMQLFN